MRRYLVLCTLLIVFGLLMSIKEADSATLNLTLKGTGGGLVYSVSSGTVSCTYPPQAGTCSSALTSPLVLMAAPTPGSAFGGWSDSCSGCANVYCTVLNDGDKNCGATFTTLPPLPPVMIEGTLPAYYPVLQKAFDEALTGAKIRSKAVAFQENLTVNSPGTVFFHGGFDDLFSTQTGYSVLYGKLIISSGTLVVDRIVISSFIDKQPPTVPANVKATAISWNQMDVTWDASTDNAGVSGYAIYRGDTNLGSTTGTSYSDSTLSAATDYCYSVFAFDSAGNISGRSAQACAKTQNAAQQGPVKVTLDASGTVQTTVTTLGPGGSQLTLYAGTGVALIGNDGSMQTPVSLDNVYLSLVDDTGSTSSLPVGVNSLAQLRIVLTIDGVEHDAVFWPASTGSTAQQGLRLLIVVAGQNVNEGTLGLLYKAVPAGNPVRVGSSALKFVGGVTSSAAALSGIRPLAPGGASGQMQYNPNSTGSYSAGGSAPGSGSAPAGAYWSSFSVADPGCIAVGNVNVCGPSRVDRIEITEESTAEILGMCWFGDSNTATTGPLPPGYQFWCERTQAASGGTTTIKISSMQANLPIVHSYLVQTGGDKLPMWETYVRASGGLHGPDGAVYSDPYQKKEFKFAGHKELHFNTRVDKDINWMKEHAFQPILNAGYSAWWRNFISTKPGFTVEVQVDTLDARLLLQEDVIEKIWKVRKSRDETSGNRGAYDYSGKYKGTAHATMFFPNLPSAKVWEINADVTFESDPDHTSADVDSYTTTSDGTVTQTVYTVPVPPNCYGKPASFTDTYPTFKGDGYLSIFNGSNPVKYNVNASISDLTPVKAHDYVECCIYYTPVVHEVCENKTMEIGAQQHEWLYMGGVNQSAQSDGTLQGTYTQQLGAAYDWNLKPADTNP